MGTSFSLRGLLVLTVMALGVVEASAQRVQRQPGPPPGAQAGGAPGAPKAEVIATHGRWQVQCTDIPVGPPPKQPPAQAGASGASGKSNKADKSAATAAAEAPKTVRQCGMLQNTQSKERKGITLTLVMGAAKQGDKTITMMRILVPIGVYLPLGIALEIDGAAVGRVPFTRCLPQICTAVAEASKETLGKMRKGANASFIIYEQPGVGINLPVSLKGFTAAHKKLLSL